MWKFIGFASDVWENLTHKRMIYSSSTTRSFRDIFLPAFQAFGFCLSVIVGMQNSPPVSNMHIKVTCRRNACPNADSYRAGKRSALWFTVLLLYSNLEFNIRDKNDRLKHGGGRKFVEGNLLRRWFNVKRKKKDPFDLLCALLLQKPPNDFL